jgi:DNA-binding PadR family transcriptional regulator
MPKSKKKPNPLKTYILGVMSLFDKELSGYELNKIAEEWRFDHYIENASQSSFYYHLKQIEDDGIIESTIKKDSSRPERIEYQITPKGTEKLITELYSLLDFKEDFYFKIDVVMPFILFLEKKKILDAIENQINHRKEQLNHLDTATLPYMKERFFIKFSPFILLIAEHHKLHYEAEIQFLTHFASMIREIDFEKSINEINKR